MQKIINEIVHNVNVFVNEPDPNLPELLPPPPQLPLPPIEKKPSLPDIFTKPEEINDDIISELKNVKEKVKKEFVPDLTPPQKTGIKSVDDKNYEEYLELLQIHRPDLFVDEENNYAGPNTNSSGAIALAPPEVDSSDTDPLNIIANPEVTTILPPPDTHLPSILPELNPPPKTGIKSVDDENYENYLNLLQTYRPDLFIDEEDDYVAPIEVDSDNDSDLLPIVVNTGNIILKDDGDVEIIDPKNMRADDKNITLEGGGVVVLPEREIMDGVRTSNLILKRKMIACQVLVKLK